MHSAHRKAYHEPAVISVTQPEGDIPFLNTRALWMVVAAERKGCFRRLGDVPEQGEWCLRTKKSADDGGIIAENDYLCRLYGAQRRS